MMRGDVRWDGVVLFGALLTLAGPASAGDGPAGAVEDQWRLRADAETWSLPASESMGMVRLGLRREINDWLAAGIDGSAAVRGTRGGFITLGVGAEALVPISGSLAAEAGVSLQAGGGRGGYQLSGGGLMTRVALGLRYAWAGREALSAGISRVDFPDGGVIRSQQVYLGYSHGFSGWSLAPGLEASPIDAGVLGTRTQRVGLTIEALQVTGSRQTVGGGPQGNFGLVGFEWQTVLGEGLYTRLAAAGAAGGSSSGYMQVLAGLGYRRPIARRFALTAAVSVGAGGGGSVSTGGGWLVEGEVGCSALLGERDSVDLAASALRAPSGEFGAHGVTLRLAHRFGLDDAGASSQPATAEVLPVRVRVTSQTYRAASADWGSRPNRSFGTFGVQADYFARPAWYLTGQGLGAARGQNGAYMIGLVGTGWHHEFNQRIYAELEALGGAAGGGGVSVGSGVVGQANVAVGYEGPGGLGLRAGIGRLQARRGGFAANVAELAFTWKTRLLSASN